MIVFSHSDVVSNFTPASLNKMANRKSIFDTLRLKMEEVGFLFETEQKPHLQNRKETELKFVHPQLINKWKEEGYNARATKFYIKPLSDEVNCEIGFVTGKSSPLHLTQIYSPSNSNDPFGDIPAWTNRVGDQALDGLLKSIKDYLDSSDKSQVFPEYDSNTFLFVWNPDVWKWTHLEQSIDLLNKTNSYSEAWSCSSFKKVKPGDRAFLMRLGKSPKGIIGSATVTSNPFYSKFRSGDEKAVPRMRVMLDFDILLNAEKEPILTLDILKQGKLASQNWTPQASGISIKPELVDELEAVWFDFVTTQKIRHNPFTKADLEEQVVYTEGTPNQVTLTKYERNPFARKGCIAHYGLSCSVCNFNFELVFGDIGKNFIHVHHINQISEIGREYEIDPIKDLIPVCPNCHAMIHSKRPAFTIEELKEIRKTAYNIGIANSGA